MKKQIILFILLLFSLQIFAQEDIADYKQFELLAKTINDIQRTADGENYKFEESNAPLNFPDINFVFNYHDLSASWIYGDEKERAITENINLAEVTSIILSDNTFGDVGAIGLSFNKKQKTAMVNNGKVTFREVENIIFYFSAKEKAKGNEMFNALAELINLVKIKKGLLTAQQAKQQQAKWETARNKNTSDAYYDFLRQEPNTIFTQMAYAKVESLDPSIKIITDKYSGFYLGMHKDEFKDLVEKRVKDVAIKDKKIDKKLKLFIDNFAINFYTNKDTKVSSYYFENTYLSIYKTHHNAGNIIYYSNDPKLGIDGNSYGTGNFKMETSKLGLSWNKKYKLEDDELPSLTYKVANIENSIIKNKFFQYSRSSILSEIIFNKQGYACQMTFSFIIYDNGMSYDFALSAVKKYFGTPFKEAFFDSRIVEGKTVYFDKGNYYVLAKVVKEYNSPLLLTLTFYVK